MLKKVLNKPERLTHKKLTAVTTEWGCNVYTKMRLADIFPIEGSGITKNDYRFALQSSFDFVVADADYNPLFCVEFDGPLHNTSKQKKRDNIKDKLCEFFNFPILRINNNYLVSKYRNYDLLSYLVEVWFLSRSFYEEQEKGNIPYDEPFDHNLIMFPNRKEGFPLWLTADIRVAIQNLYNVGRCKDFGPSTFVGFDKYENYRAIAYIRIDNEYGVYVETGMRKQNFPIVLGEIIEEIAVHDLYSILFLFQF